MTKKLSLDIRVHRIVATTLPCLKDEEEEETCSVADDQFLKLLHALDDPKEKGHSAPCLSSVPSV